MEEDMQRFDFSGEADRIAALPAKAQDFYNLGRVAMKTTCSKMVLAIGGGGIAAQEADASLLEGVQWVIFALSRGRKEENPSILDGAIQNDSSQVQLFGQIDEKEADGFCGVAPIATSEFN